MIRRIFSDLASFKEMTFRPGLNLILADKSPGATDRQTRNAAGKTSLIELIHFLTGADCKPDSLFRKKELASYTFGMEFDLAGAPVSVQRRGEKPSKLIVSGDTSSWPISPTLERSTGNFLISNTEWRSVLGKLIFGLTGSDDDDTGKFSPTFRSLFAYFVRRQASEAFTSPEKQAAMQQKWDQQVAISYLLGLDWTIPQQWQFVRERESALKELRKAAAGGVFGHFIGTTAELRTKLAVAEERTRQMRERVGKFQVLADYHDQEQEASTLTRQLSELANANTMDRQLLADLESSIDSEAPPPFSNLETMYRQVGIELPETAVRRFDEVRRFHESVIQNRRSYLSQEIHAATKRIADRSKQQGDIDRRRSQIMAILKEHGALEHYSLLQTELTKREAESESVRQQFITAEQLESRKAELDIERTRLLIRLKQDYHERRERLEMAIVAFEEISNDLYENPGSLTIKETPNGPEFEVQIHGSDSTGIKKMQIFCFDIMFMSLRIRQVIGRGFLTQQRHLSEGIGRHSIAGALQADSLRTQQFMGPDFLVHDSHLFDGVDGRQVAKALQVGAEKATALDFQYIVTMNSDVVPTELPPDFSPADYILPVRLTDTPTGGLFGFSFD
jgi:uncharacterized protein YydD (DUF2326 family)